MEEVGTGVKTAEVTVDCEYSNDKTVMSRQNIVTPIVSLLSMNVTFVFH